MTKRTTKEIGNKGETYAAKYLKKHKYKILEKNYTKPYGEIDIIAENKEFIVFVEVKTRKENSVTAPVDAVNYKKRRKISLVADEYLSKYNIEKQCRFDVCEVFVNGDNLKLCGINYMKDAF